MTKTCQNISELINVTDYLISRTNHITIRFVVVAGFLKRKQFRQYLNNSSEVSDHISVSYTESKGILENQFFVKVEGEPSSVSHYLKTTNILFPA